MKKRTLLLFMVLAVVFSGGLQAGVILDVSFGELGYDADGLTADGQLCVDYSGNGYHGFYGGGSGGVVATGVTDTTALDTSENDVYIILRPDRTYAGHGVLGLADPVTTPTPYWVFEADKSYTFEAILQWDPASAGTRQGIMGTTGGTEIWMRMDDGVLDATFDDGPDRVDLTNIDLGNVEDGQWHHIALVLDRDAEEIRVYVDYDLVWTETTAEDADLAELDEIAIPGTQDWRLGAYNTNAGDRHDGLQDHYRISNEALEPADFLQINGAVAPTPADGSSEVDVDVDLSWASAPDPCASTDVVTGQYVYFGTDPNSLVLQNPIAQTETTYDPGTLNKDTRYYWRVDASVNDSAPTDPNTVAGLVWSFQTPLSFPVIDENPQEALVWADQGESAVFTVSATDPLDGTLTYQWYEGVSPDTTSPVGGNDSTLTIPNIVKADEGRQFYCRVSNINGSTDSASARIEIKDLVAHWKLDDVGGVPNADDSSGNGYDGTNVGAVLAAGKIDEAFEFADTENDYVDLTAHVGSFASLEEGTITAWVKTSMTGVGTIISASDSSVGSTEGRLILEGGNLIWDVRDEGGSPGGEPGSLDGPDVNDGEWHMVAVAVDDSPVGTLYIDGVAVKTEAEPFWGQIGVLNSMAIGRNVDNGGGQWHFDGLLDDVRVYDFAMSPEEIAELYSDVEGPYCPVQPQYDFDGDCEVNLSDLNLFVSAWLECNIYPTCTTDIP